MCIINHVLVDVEDSTAVHKVRVEPAVEGKLLVIVELDSNIIIDKNFSASDEEVIVGKPSNKLHLNFLLFLVAIEDVTFTDDVETWEYTSLRQVWYRNHPDLVYFLDDSVKFLWQVHELHDLLPFLLHEMLKVVDVSNL